MHRGEAIGVIELGSMTVRDQDSITEVRQKVLALVRALGGAEVAATRAATAISETARRCLVSAGGAAVSVALAGADRDARLQMRVQSNGPTIDAAPLRLFFERVASPPEGASAMAELALPTGVFSPALLERERARIASKSRAELMEELRDKNRQLEDYNATLEDTVAQRTTELRTANDRMQRDLSAGAAYVRNLIPAPATDPVALDWRYVPSSSLGGDTIGYHWIDEDHLALYLIDVTGHGLDSALLAVTITNVIRSATLPGVDMRRPDQVVAALNEAFQAERHGRKYFTVWYGVYQRGTRRVAWSGGGHHPAVLLVPGENEPGLLEASGPIMGAAPGMDYPAETRAAPAGSRLLLFSDGVFEILRDEKVVWTFQGMIEYLKGLALGDGTLMDELLRHVHELRGSTQLDDDFSIIEARFP